MDPTKHREQVLFHICGNLLDVCTNAARATYRVAGSGLVTEEMIRKAQACERELYELVAMITTAGAE